MLISISKKKPKNNRSAFLSAMMKTLGGDTGNALADAFMGKDADAFESKLGEVAKQLRNKMPNVSKEA